MSLNGLDDPKIKEAHDTAVAEPGGWFLLKYTSRDEVDLLGRGNGGIVDMRNAIAQYQDPAPLFGFLRYRRRNVVIKYVPEDTSRLVQARVTVHFIAVTERFSPHDTVFPITTSKELRDTTLSAACSLHTASGSTSSSTSSLRRRRLMEIAEDEEEEAKAKRHSTVPEERPTTAKTLSVTAGPPSDPPSFPQPELPLELQPSISYRSVESDDSYTLPAREAGNSEARSRSPTRSIGEPRKSSQSTRPDIYSLHSYGSNGRPKVKLGPRPSLDVGGRPHTSGASTTQYRPTSSLPAGLKAKGSKKDKDRSKSAHPTETPSMTVSPPLDAESLLNPAHHAPARPHTSGGRPSTASSYTSTKGLASPTFSTHTPKITPEKARLMKALELRKRHMNSAANPAAGPTSPISSASISSSILASPKAPNEGHETSSMLDDMHKDDSAIAFDAGSTMRTDESDATRSDSCPVSPVGPSEPTESTKASSISESTDETVLEPNIAKELPTTEEMETEASMDTAPNARSAFNIDPTSAEPVAEPLELLSPATYEPVAHVCEDIKEEESAEEPLRPVEQEQMPEFSPKDYVDKEAHHPTDDATEDVIPTAPIAEPDVAPTAEGNEEPNAEREADEPAHVALPLASPSWKAPRSKFSTQDPEAEEGIENPLEESSSLPTINQPENATAQKSPVGSTFSAATKQSLAKDGQEEEESVSKSRRRGVVEPIRTDLDVSEDNLSSDDEFMDELSSAVVEEAKPISVSKSPISPAFPSPTKKRDGEQSRVSRVFSSPVKKEKADTLTPELANQPQRSSSAGAAYLNRISQQNMQPVKAKVNLGGGIAQRIKALEKFGLAPPGSSPAPGSTGPPPGTSPSFFSVRKTTARGKSPSIADRANSLNRSTPSPGPYDSSPETAKIRERSSSIKSRLDTFKSSPEGNSSRSRPESVSVTARIIRDPSQPFPAKSEAGKEPHEYTPLNLKQSPLVIDHRKAGETSKQTIKERRLSKDKERRGSNATIVTATERRSSITVIKDLIKDRRSSFSGRRQSMNLEPLVTSPSLVPQRPSSSRHSSHPPSTHTSPHHNNPRLSIGSRSSNRDPSSGLSPPQTAESLSSNSDEKSDKKANRANRMMRRMSSSLSAGKIKIQHAMSPTVREESEPPTTADSQSMTSSFPSHSSMAPTNVEVGDVNVQFPDTLLWKRRSMLLDSQGFVIMSPALNAQGSAKDKARRFHLSGFRTPVVPDMEMEEMPNSVVLDFVEGGGLQVACEDRAGQGRILKVLQEAHRSWAAYGQ